MDYGAARSWIRKVGKGGSSFGLAGITHLMGELGNVQDRLKLIHVAGTNGKGSVTAMLAGLLQEAGYVTGRYSSPAVFSTEEVWQVNGQPISKKEYGILMGQCKEACDRLVHRGLPHPSAFEIETAVAFLFFARHKCQYGLVEAGLGGREDATNLIRQPVCSVLTSISRDHMELLGESLEEIAAAKAGIIKESRPVVTASQEAEVLEVIEERARLCSSRLYLADRASVQDFVTEADQEGRLWSRFSYDDRDFSAQDDAGKSFTGGQMQPAQRAGALNLPYSIQTPLVGSAQKENLACLLKAVEALRDCGIAIPDQALVSGLKKLYLPGRLECLGLEPAFYIDGAHNERAAAYLRKTLDQCFSERRWIYIIGVMADKEYDKVLAHMVPGAAEIFTVRPDNPRALSAEALAEAAAAYLYTGRSKEVKTLPARRAGIDGSFLVDYGERIHACQTAAQAVREAESLAGKDDLILAFGSFYYLKEVKEAYRRKER